MNRPMSWGKLVFLCLVLVVVFIVGQSKINDRIGELTAEETALRIDLSGLRDEGGELDRQIAVVGTDVYIMNEARTNYNFLREGEMRFSFVNPGELAKYSDEERQILEYELSID